MIRLIVLLALCSLTTSAFGQEGRRTEFSSSNYRWSLGSRLQANKDFTKVAILRSGSLDIVSVDEPQSSRTIWSIDEEMHKHAPQWIKVNRSFVRWSVESDVEAGSLAIIASHGQKSYLIHFSKNCWDRSEGLEISRWDLPRIANGFLDEKEKLGFLVCWGNTRKEGQLLFLKRDQSFEAEPAPFRIQHCWRENDGLLICSLKGIGKNTNLRLSRAELSAESTDLRFSRPIDWNTASTISSISRAIPASAATTFPARVPPQHNEYLFSGITITNEATATTLPMPYRFNRLQGARWSYSGRFVCVSILLDLVGDLRSFQGLVILGTESGTKLFVPPRKIYPDGTFTAKAKEEICAVSDDGSLVFTAVTFGPGRKRSLILYDFRGEEEDRGDATESSCGKRTRN